MLTGENHGACGYLKVCGGWSNQSPIGLVPIEISAALVDDLYSALRSLAIGAITGGAGRRNRGFAHRQPLVEFSDRCDRMPSLRARTPYDRVLQAQVVHRRRWGRAASLGTMVRSRCLGLRGMPRKHVLRRLRVHRRPILPSAACCLRGRIYGRNYGAHLQPAVDRNNAWFPSFCCPSPSPVRFAADWSTWRLSAITFLYYLATIELARYLGANRLRLLLTTGQLAEQNFRFDTALANMSHGLCMFDSTHRLVVWNRRFCEIYKLPPEVLSPGITIRKLIELSAARGNYPDRVRERHRCRD